MAKSYLLVTVQIASIIFLIRTGSIWPSNIVLLILLIIFLLFAFYAMYELKFRFNIFPELLENSKLITTGPFKKVRHPIYTSIIFITLILVINKFSFLRLGVWILLVIILNVKLEYEEKLLLNEFPAYKEYKTTSKKLIPFIY